MAIAFVVVALSGCTELRGRRKVREGNQLYRDGHYAEALKAYEAAESFLPAMPLLWFNKGLACRQLMIPGAKTAENERAVECALGAFQRLKELSPGDGRADSLYVQTLFDADRFDALAALYQERVRRNPRDLESINGLIQVYSRANRMQDALAWYQKKAQLLPNDAEAQYAVGVFVWRELFARGGGPERASFDPRPDPNKPKEKKIPPPFAVSDIVGPQREALSDIGIRYLERGLAVRPKYHEAMVYLNLLYRQKSFAYFSDPAKWQATVDTAERWRKQAMEGMGIGAAAQGAATAKPSTPASETGPR